MDARDSFLSNLADLESRSTPAPAWLSDLRQRGLEVFRSVGFPSTQHEDWKYTNVGPWLKTPFRRAGGYRRNGLGPAQAAQLGLGDFAAQRLVFVDGNFVAELSDLTGIGSGVELYPLLAAEAGAVSTLAAQLGAHARPETNGFLALNTACLGDGAVLRVARGAAVDTPVHVIYVTSSHAERVAVYPRTLVLAEENSQASVIESHVCDGAPVYLSNAVTEIVAAPGANIEHASIVLSNANSLHVGALAVHQQRASQVTLHSFAFNGGLVRSDVAVRLDGEGAECSLNGLFAAAERSHIDSHTTIEHVQPACTSHELYKGVLGGAATGVFNGLIRVHPQAQKSVARQASKNLLLSGDAQVNTKPQLEIHADDVRCNHGSTIGQLDEESLFYLRARGLDQEAAVDLLTYAFAAEMVERVKCAPLRASLEKEVRARMPRRG